MGGVSKKYVVDFKSDGDDNDDDSTQATCTTILLLINGPNTLHQPVSVVTEPTKNIGPDQKQTGMGWDGCLGESLNEAYTVNELNRCTRRRVSRFVRSSNNNNSR